MKNKLTLYRYTRILLFYGVGLFLNLSNLYSQEGASSLFAEANKAYNEANYSDAVARYKQILAEGQHSAALYYNLGNAFYRLNQVAESIYFFE